MKSDFIHIKTESLNNHCPECFTTEGLQLSFKQKYKETLYYRTLTNEISYDLHCKICNTEIFPVRWTDNIERIIDYKKKTFKPQPKSFKLTRLAWVLIISLDVLIVLGILVGANVIKV